MTVTVEPGDPRHPQATALLQASHALMQSLFPPEDNHYLSIDALCTDDIRFFVAKDSGKIIACGALALKNGYAEVKSMFVDPTARGQGTADAMLTRLIAEAKAANLPLLRLETGNTLHAAHRLYARHGFQPCGPFGNYAANVSSLFMEKRLP